MDTQILTVDDEELGRVIGAIKSQPDPHVRAALMLLIITGVRLSEALGAQWQDIDLASATWRIPSPKSGHPQVIPLHPDAVELLEDLPRLGPWVIPGRNPEKRRADLKKPWAQVRKAAKVEGVTIHDLRRTFGLAVARSAGLHVASKLLRHSNVTVTERVYAPLGFEDLRAGLEKTARARAKVVPIRPGVTEGCGG